MALSTSFTPLFFLPLCFFLPLLPLLGNPFYWVGALLPTTLFLLLYGGLFLPKSAPLHRTDPPPFTLMTFNMLGTSRKAETAQVIRENGLPDIVVLQEMTPMLRRLVLQEVGDEYPYTAFDVTLNNRGLGVLSRFPIHGLPTDMLVELNCRLYQVDVTPSEPFLLYNCHPRSTNIFYFFNDGVPFDRQVQESFTARRLWSERLAAEVAQQTLPVLVVGDFNTTDQSDAYHQLRSQLLDAHRSIGWSFGHTFPAETGWFRRIPIVARQVRIDMVLYTPTFVALQSRVSAAHGESDHLPLVVRMGWRQ
ncbi:MAG: endonuclease/exonuclease/phosphatase family protein [Caldilineaceae bacterium]